MKKASSFHISVTVTLFCFQLLATEPVPSEKAVPNQRISVHEYQNFIGNWYDKTNPVLCALIQSPKQYSSVFHAAAVMRGKKPYAPANELFDKEQIVLIAKVMTAPVDMDKSFADVTVSETGDTLMVSYRLNDAKSGATHSVKNFLSLRIHKKNYKRVLFQESGTQVAELQPSDGVWCNIKLEVQ
ncbi:MAG: hypothetical protein WCN98_11725 [Verrucomicrobiaceae bacterium]